MRADEELVKKKYVNLAENLGAKIVTKGVASHYVYFLKELNAMPKTPADACNVHMYFVLSSYFNCVKMPESEFAVHC